MRIAEQYWIASRSVAQLASYGGLTVISFAILSLEGEVALAKH